MHSAVHNNNSTEGTLSQRCVQCEEMAKKNKAAVELGRKGGKNSRKNLTADERKELAQRAANARWAKKPKGEGKKK